jgi:hypothetical protein
MEEYERQAIARSRDVLFADMIALAIGLAAETHPDLLRNALARVFDLSAVEDTSKRILAVVTDCQSRCHAIQLEVSALLTTVREDINEVEKQLDGLRHTKEKR